MRNVYEFRARGVNFRQRSLTVRSKAPAGPLCQHPTSYIKGTRSCVLRAREGGRAHVSPVPMKTATMKEQDSCQPEKAGGGAGAGG